MRIDEFVDLVEYDDKWQDFFICERRRICHALSVQSNEIEHIGSTVVPGLVAKPIVDLMLGIDTIPPSEDTQYILEKLDYEQLGEAGVPGRFYFRYRDTRSINLHIVLKGGKYWVQNVALRDYLRSHPSECQRYAEHKRNVFIVGANRLLQYSEAKNKMVTELMNTIKKDFVK